MYIYIYIYVFLILFIIILHDPLLCSNTTCIGGFLHNYIISATIPCSMYKFVEVTIIVCNLSRVILFVNFLKLLLNLLMSFFLLTGQFSVRNAAAFRLSLSCSSSLQSYSMWSTVCSPLLQEHIGLSKILYLCRYDLILILL